MLKMGRKMNGKIQIWLHSFVCMLILLETESFLVDITYVQNAEKRGAVCLDGSPATYYLHEGSGNGTNNWIIRLEGGGWCNNPTTCLEQINTKLGSSISLKDKQNDFSGFFGNNSNRNPDFYDWNIVKINYCDGASFTGDVEEAVDINGTKLYYRGARVFTAVMEDLLAKGMKNANNVILSGCSAGGLAAILHCDNFGALFSNATNVKCMADAGFFINSKDISGAPTIANFFDEVVTTHGSTKQLQKYCTSKMKPSLCFFPQNMVQGIQTPLFIVNAAYDSWQIKNILAPGIADKDDLWDDCKKDITKCSTDQLTTIEGFRNQFINAISISKLSSSASNGFFINSCYSHCQTGVQDTWLSDDSPLLKNEPIAKAVGDWFYGRDIFRDIENCSYPCDKTCHNRVFD